jgi:putative transposase
MTAPRGFRVGAHSVHSLHAHIVFAPKYRRHVLTERVFAVLHDAWLAVCADTGATLVEANCEGDHCHLLLMYPPSVILSSLVRRLKGSSSRRVRAMRFPEVTRRLWGCHFWSASYCVVSCGGTPLAVIAKYVRSQDGATANPAGGGASPPR